MARLCITHAGLMFAGIPLEFEASLAFALSSGETRDDSILPREHHKYYLFRDDTTNQAMSKQFQRSS